LNQNPNFDHGHKKRAELAKRTSIVAKDSGIQRNSGRRKPNKTVAVQKNPAKRKAGLRWPRYAEDGKRAAEACVGCAKRLDGSEIPDKSNSKQQNQGSEKKASAFPAAEASSLVMMSSRGGCHAK